jgi:hypothetical protein
MEMSNGTNENKENIQKVNILDVSDKAVDNLLREVDKTIHGGIDLEKVRNMTAEEVKELDARRDELLSHKLDFSSSDSIDKELDTLYGTDSSEYRVLKAYFKMWDYDRKICKEVLSSKLLQRDIIKTNVFEAEYMALMQGNNNERS